MAKKAQIVSTVTGTGSTTDLTISGFGDIDGAIITIVGCTADDTDTVSNQHCVVYWDRTASRCMNSWDGHGYANTTTLTHVGYYPRLYTTAGALDCEGVITNITDGLRITWDAGELPGSSWKIDAVLFGGGLDVKVADMLLSSTIDGSLDYSGTTFTPDLIMMNGGHIAANMPGTEATTLNNNWGFAINDGARSQFAMCNYNQNNRISGAYNNLMNHTDRINGIIGNLKEQEITAFNTDGFTITNRAGTNNGRVVFICIGGLADVAINTSMVTTSTGSASITDAGFEPDFAMFLRNRPTNLDQEYSNLNSRVTIGFTDGTNEVGTTFHGDDGSATTDTGQRHSVSKVIDSYQGEGEDIAATFTSFDSGGLTVNFSSAGISTGATLLLQFESGGEPPADNSVPWMSWF